MVLSIALTEATLPKMGTFTLMTDVINSIFGRSKSDTTTDANGHFPSATTSEPQVAVTTEATTSEQVD
ncbi:MAG: hypothetical protein M3443_12620, partial [Actinomycetota bacterium]|nr:hypothetical protein [Actinomycetota bacterium]